MYSFLKFYIYTWETTLQIKIEDISGIPEASLFMITSQRKLLLWSLLLRISFAHLGISYECVVWFTLLVLAALASDAWDWSVADHVGSSSLFHSFADQNSLCKYHILCSHFSTDIHLGCLQFGSSMNESAMNIIYVLMNIYKQLEGICQVIVYMYF